MTAGDFKSVLYVMIPLNMMKALRTLATERKLSISEIIRNLIAKELKNAGRRIK